MNREDEVLIFSGDEYNDSGAIELTDPIEDQEQLRPGGEFADARQRLNQKDQEQTGNLTKKPRIHQERNQFDKARLSETREHRQNDGREHRNSGPNFQRYKGNGGKTPQEWNQGQRKHARNRQRGNFSDNRTTNEGPIVADDQRELINSLRRINDLNEDNKLLQKNHERVQLELSDSKNKLVLLQKRVEELELQRQKDGELIKDFEKKSITRTILPLAELTEERNKMVNPDDKKKERRIKVLKAQIERLKKESDNDQTQLKDFRKKREEAEEALDNFQAECSCRKNDIEA